MPLNSGSRLGSYEVLSVIGAGGMGEVYRARDAKLNRDVALKILPETFADDAERIARFRREAQLLASLNHPHIAQIHGFEDSGATHALVMELVEGPTLAERIAAGPLELRDAIAIARQIADALEAAHEQGIVHRDLKPANIKVRDDGTVKVLDFGLAKALAPEGSAASADAMLSPTLTARSTQLGVILGTAAYMSPEQAKGKTVDKRTDVWAFGCVLYEMLTGRMAFGGDDITDTIAAIVRGDPDWTRLPPSVPEQIRLLIQRCLEKDRRARVSDIGVARFLLTETVAAAPPTTTARTPPWRWRRLALTAAALVAAITCVAAGAWLGRRSAAQPAPLPARFTVVPGPPHPLALQSLDRNLAISADGSNIVYRSGTAFSAQFAVRSINDLNPRVIGDVFAREPFLSPDGQWLGYFTAGEMRKVAMSGGPSARICSVSAPPRGMTWAAGDVIIFGIAESQKGLQIVSAAGGEARALTTPDTAAGEATHYFPSALPDGRSVLFTIGASGSPLEDGRIAILDIGTGRYKTLVRGGSSPVFVEPGYIVYATPGALRAVRFDPRRLEVIGEPVTVVDHVMTSSLGNANFALSRTGTLVFVPGGAQATELPGRSLVWVDRRGAETPVRAPERPYGSARLSPDGTRVALDVRGATGSDIWVYDVGREALTPVNLDAGLDLAPVWTHDGRRIIWASTRATVQPQVYWQAADGTGTAERLASSERAQFPTSVTPDGTRLVLFTGSATLGVGGTDLFLLPFDAAARRLEPLLQSVGQKMGAEVSPDGRWIAYQSNEAGDAQVFVRPFPAVDGSRVQISTDGGSRPAWGSGGRELFYLDRNDLLSSVEVRVDGDRLVPAKPVKVLTTRYVTGATTRGYALRSYDVSADGKRFLMLRDAAAPTAPPLASMTVVVNWIEELKARLPQSSR